MIEITQRSKENPTPPRDSASYYKGGFPLALCFLLSPGLWVWSLTIFGGSYLNFLTGAVFLVFSAGLLAAVILPRNREFLRRLGKATLVSFLLCAAVFVSISLFVSTLSQAKMGQLGGGFRGTLGSIGIAMDYMNLEIQLYSLVPLFSFAALWRLRRRWSISAALLLAVANLPFWAIGMFIAITRFMNR